MKIIADERIPFVREFVADLGELVLKPGRELNAQDVQYADALLVRSVTPVNAELMQESSVKFVGSVTAGKDHLDEAFLQEAGIQYATAAGFNAPSVADYVVSVVAGLQRKQVLPSDKKKAVVVGVGHVGKLVAERLKVLGFDVGLCDPLRAEVEPGFESVPLDEIANVDLICLHTPLTTSGDYPTKHMIDAAFLKRQTPGAVLLNAGRGEVIKADDLESSGKHLFWCLDVWPDEPDISKTILERAIVATPHIAGYSVESKRRGITMIYQALCQAFDVIPKLTLMDLPKHELSFACDIHFWQDIVLGAYNPIVNTAMMRAALLQTDEVAYCFDEMRHQFQVRHELAYTQAKGVNLPEDDRLVLTGLGVG